MPSSRPRLSFDIETAGGLKISEISNCFNKTLQDRYTNTIGYEHQPFEELYLDTEITYTFYYTEVNNIYLVVCEEFLNLLSDHCPASKAVVGLAYHTSADVTSHEFKSKDINFHIAELEGSKSGFLKKHSRNEHIPSLGFKYNTKMSKLLELASGSMSKETASSAPSMVLHQLASIMLCTSSINDCQFESSNYANKPDLVINLGHGKTVFIDITSTSHVKKLNSYHSNFILSLNKTAILWSVIDYVFCRDKLTIKPASFLHKLCSFSSINDLNSWDFLQSCINKQKEKVDDPQLYSPAVMEYITRTPDNVLSRDCRVAKQAFKRYIDTLKVKEEIPTFTWETAYSFKPFSWLGFQLGQPSVEASFETGEPPRLLVSDDKLVINTENQSLPGDRSFFSVTKNSPMQMDYRSYQALISYVRLPDKVHDDDLHYYNRILRDQAPNRRKNYFRELAPGKLKRENPTDPDSDFVIKGEKSLTNLYRIQPNKPTKFKVPETISEIHNYLYTDLKTSIDPIDEAIISECQPDPVYIKYLTKSKVYQILNLFRKASEALSYSAKDNTFFEIQHSQTSMSLNIYVSGSPTQTDKGIAYVSLINEGSLIKTWLWRSADIKDYKVACSRMITTTMTAWKMIQDPKRQLYMLTLYSLLLLENSWGMSKVLKPYRYLVTGLSYGSPMTHLTKKKFEESISDNRAMCKNKKSFSYMSAILNDDMSESGTPMFGLNTENMGFEAFLMNLCPSTTYGKRRHQVNMLLEIVEEIEMAEKSHSKVLEAQDEFVKLIQIVSSDPDIRNSDMMENLFFSYLISHVKRSETLSGRFTFTPYCLLLIYPEIKKICNSCNFQGTAPPIRELMTMKASFDPIDFRNCSALESISKLCQKENLTTTSSIAINLLNRCIDLTFRMFDKDQLGGDREISIMSSEFRILQSITESFAKKMGYETGIDMLDNGQKVSLLSDAQNQANKFGGIRQTIDQTRWGPNFNTVTFGYMFMFFSRFTTEAFFPVYTCIMSEHKVFQMLPHPELSKFQKTGTTLPGLKGQYHMGQGIFHYSSSLYHSLVHGFLSKIKSEKISKKGSGVNDTVVAVRSFVTSDDVAIINYYYTKPGKTQADENGLALLRDHVMKLSKTYDSYIQIFGIKTSTYKNLVSDQSFEFNSIFLNKDSVGSNSLKFLYSLVDPFTSGDEKRDMRKIFDSYVDALNSGLSPEEAKIICLCNLKIRLLQWGYNSETILTLIDLYSDNERDCVFKESGENYSLPILCTSQTVTRDPDNDICCDNVLPYKKYKEHKYSMNKYREMLAIEQLKIQADVKRDTLSRAKKRRLGSNRGLVLTKEKRRSSKIRLPVFNKLSALTISGPAYLAMVIRHRSESSMLNLSDGYVLRPSSNQKTLEQGFSIKKYKTSDSCLITSLDLLYSSYERQPFINNNSSDLEILLHIGRNHKRLKLINNKDLDQWSFTERLLYFDEVISNAKTSGNACQLVYSRAYNEYLSYHFPVLQENLSYLPQKVILRTTENLGMISCPVRNVFHLDKVGRNYACNHSTDPLKILQYVSEGVYELSLDDLVESAAMLLRTDHTYTSTSARMKGAYLNLKLTVKREKTDKNNMSFDGAKVGSLESEISLGGSPIVITDEMSEMLREALAECGIDLEEETSKSIDTQDPDDLIYLFGGSTHEIETKYISIQCPRYMTCIGQGWFKKHCIFNGNLLSLIRQGFCQNTSNTQPESILYSILENVREAISTETLKRKTKFSHVSFRSPDIRLSGLFNINTELRNLAACTYVSTVTTSSKSRMSSVLKLVRNPSSITVDLIEGLPAVMSVTDRPRGIEVNIEEMQELINLSCDISYDSSSSENSGSDSD